MNEPIQRFEDIIAWQKARVLTREVYLATKRETFRKDFGLANQIQRAAVSVMANIAEGYERHGQGEFYHFLGTAKASCAEVGSHLYVALDVGYLTQSQFDALHRQVNEVGRILGSFRAAVGRNRKDGSPSRSPE